MPNCDLMSALIVVKLSSLTTVAKCLLNSKNLIKTVQQCQLSH